MSAALEVVEADGLEGLSMRRLAQELDVWPMAVYRYFRDKDELLDAMVDAAGAQVELPDGTAPWREEIGALLLRARSELRRYGGGLGIPLGRLLLTPSGLRISEAGIATLACAGLEPEEAARAWRALFSYAVGAAAEPDADEAARRARVALAGLSEDEYPALAAAVDGFAGANEPEAELEYGLERLLDGLEARVAA